MTYRVALWGTGWAGRQAIPGIVGHPDLELAGTYVTSPDKDGHDVGELAGIAPIGVRATSDVDQHHGSAGRLSSGDVARSPAPARSPRSSIGSAPSSKLGRTSSRPRSCRSTTLSSPLLRCASR